MKRFYAADSARKAWAVFLGISATVSTLDANVRKRSKDPHRKQRAKIVQEARDAAGAERKRKKEKQEAERAEQKAQTAAAQKVRKTEANEKQALRDDVDSRITDLEEQLRRLKEQRATEATQKASQEAMGAEEPTVTNEEVQEFIEKMKSNPEGDDYKMYYERFESNGERYIRNLLIDKKENPDAYTDDG